MTLLKIAAGLSLMFGLLLPAQVLAWEADKVWISAEYEIVSTLFRWRSGDELVEIKDPRTSELYKVIVHPDGTVRTDGIIPPRPKADVDAFRGAELLQSVNKCDDGQ